MYNPLKRWHRREKKIAKNGYVVVWVPEHPKSFRGWVYEHRMVVEAQLGRTLETWEEVHHIDRIRSHNVAPNLFLCTRYQHSKAHRHMQDQHVVD